jgi:hypothetical protein
MLGLVRPRSASEWRSFWHQGGEQELAAVLRSAWPSIGSAVDELVEAAAERIALLLGSAAPPRAIASELGRIRGELGLEGNAETDTVAADAVHTWFEAQRPAGGVSCGS